MPSCPPRLAARRAALALALLLAACGSDEVVSPVDTSASTYWALRLDRQAITLGIAAPYDTLRLVATPVSSSGEPIEGPKPATFTTTNVNTVAVHADGRLQAKALTPGAQIIASLTYKGVTHADTATVAVTRDPGALTVASFSIQPVAPDSARFAIAGSLLEPFHNIAATVLDAAGNPLFGLPVRYRSLDETAALVDPWSGTVSGLKLGYFPVVATMTAYGRSFSDTLRFRIQRPAYAKVNVFGPQYGFVKHVTGSFSPDSITVGVGAVVEWENTGMPEESLIDVTFDEAAAATLDSVPEQSSCLNYGIDCDGIGSITPFGPPKLLPDGSNFDEYFKNLDRARRFTAPGVYRYRNTHWNTEGVVVVVDEAAP
ncbi:MAG TPA: hypothetical protein VJQ44_09585 [Gemmatimonadales bacterium]|nr:hypothetical protein [Gemmatimonadales bacterium]